MEFTNIGYNNNNIDTSLKLIKYLDMYLGIPSVLKDPDTKRRNLYGKAGCFRLTSYGCEYRVLSSYFIKDDETISWVWDRVFKAINAYNDDKELISSDLVQETINESNTELAKELIRNYNI